MHFPIKRLREISTTTIAAEIEEVMPELYLQMQECELAAIAPLCLQRHTRGWVLLGLPFSEEVHSPKDFEQVERLFAAMAQQVCAIEERLDHVMEAFGQVENVALRKPASAADGTEKRRPHESRLSMSDVKLIPGKSLDEHLSEQEKRLIDKALRRAKGNISEAARLLGLRPNTLHYKIKKHRILKETAPPDQ